MLQCIFVLHYTHILLPKYPTPDPTSGSTDRSVSIRRWYCTLDTIVPICRHVPARVKAWLRLQRCVIKFQSQQVSGNSFRLPNKALRNNLLENHVNCEIRTSCLELFPITTHLLIAFPKTFSWVHEIKKC